MTFAQNRYTVFPSGLKVIVFTPIIRYGMTFKKKKKKKKKKCNNVLSARLNLKKNINVNCMIFFFFNFKLLI